MKITGVNVYQLDLPLKEGRYTWADGKFVEIFDSTIVEVRTDDGLNGFGEICPLGPFYLPSYAAGARAGIAELAPHILGLDPCQTGVVNVVMDAAMRGHPYVKSALDIACWDILGKASNQPVCNLLGGRHGESVMLYRAISQDEPEAMAKSASAYRSEGYRRFQLKVGNDPHTDIDRINAVRAALQPDDILIADANTGWSLHEAMRVVAAVKDVDVYIEQPCMTYEECLSIRRHTNRPFVLDECVDGVDMLCRAFSDNAMDIVNVKISKMGGLTKARQARNLCASMGVAMTIEDTWGGDVITAAIAHLAHSTPEKFRFTSTDFNSYVTKSFAAGAPMRVNGKMQAAEKPGLGIDVDMTQLGDPVAVIA